MRGDIEDPLTLHLHLYCNANPISLVDPSGFESEAEVVLTTDIDVQNSVQNIVKTDRARRIVNYVCNGAKALDQAAEAISGVYIIVGVEQTYVGSSINIVTRLANHSGDVGDLIDEVGTDSIEKIPVDLGAAEEFQLSEGGLLRVVEQRFLQDLTAGGIGADGNLNRIRARALKKFDSFVKSFCPGGTLQ